MKILKTCSNLFLSLYESLMFKETNEFDIFNLRLTFEIYFHKVIFSKTIFLGFSHWLVFVFDNFIAEKFT